MYFLESISSRQHYLFVFTLVPTSNNEKNIHRLFAHTAKVGPQISAMSENNLVYSTGLGRIKSQQQPTPPPFGTPVFTRKFR